MKKEDIIYMREQLLEHCSVKELMDEEYRGELLKLFTSLKEILSLLKFPTNTGLKYYKLKEDLKKEVQSS